MSQLTITARFKDAGVPATGLIPAVTVRKTDNTVVLNAQSMTEMADGFYKYDWNDFDILNSYLFSFDGGGSLSDTDRYLEAEWSGISDWVAQMPRSRSGIGAFSLKASDIDKIKESIQESFKQMLEASSIKFDLPDLSAQLTAELQKFRDDFFAQESEKDLKEMTKALKKTEKAVSNIEKIKNSFLEFKESMDKDMTDLAKIIALATKANKDGKESMDKDMTDLAKIVTLATKANKDAAEKSSKEMADLAKSLRLLTEVSEAKIGKIKNDLSSALAQ